MGDHTIKTCSICKENKREEDFNFKQKFLGKRQSNCRACQKIWKDLHYKNNKDHYLKRNKVQKAEWITWYKNYKKDLSCIKCGENHPSCLEFHHTDPSKKEGSPSSLLRQFGIKRFLQEIETCQVLCSNCHRKYHWPE